MAVEIRELVIKAVITQSDDCEPGGKSNEAAPQNQQQLVQECVDQVMKILKQTQNR